MAFRGERFVLDLDDESGAPEIPSPFSLIGEIQERAPSTAIPPAPKPTSSSTGFPAPRQRKPSSFKQRRADQSQTSSETPATDPPTIQDDKKHIDEENRRHLAAMSEAQIQREREELMEQMDPGLLERFLRRANIEEDQNTDLEPSPPKPKSDERPKPRKSVSFNIPTSSVPASASPSAQSHSLSKPPSKPHTRNQDLAPTALPQDLHPASQQPSLDPATLETFHFPQPTTPMPVLDPNSPSFLSDLQSHYFPEIAQDPSTLSWLQPLSANEEDPDSTSAYHPASNAISMAPSAIRFSLTGTILAPETSLSLPTTMGLHHHGEDPHAAGYTIPELAILSRSTFPAQRCIAWQVIGRILFRLGRAEFGERGGQLSEGLWFVIEKEGVVAGMLAEADGNAGQTQGRNKSKDENEEQSDLPLASGVGRHASAAAWAVEGIWLWQQGGGGDRGLLKEGQQRAL
jgi:hypothetical protein